MDFIKKNYEKVLLGLVLAGLVGALVFMLFYISADRQQMEEKSNSVTNPNVKPLTNLVLNLQESALARLRAPYVLDFETGNKVFNPMEWQKGPDGLPIRHDNIGPRACVVTNITPLYLVITLDAVATNELGVRYTLGVEKQSATTAAKRRKQQRFVSVGEKPNDVFALVEVTGPADNPEALLIKLVDSGETVPVTKENPYRRVDGYTAGFRYDLERKGFPNRRVGDKVTFGGTDYVVSEINQNELILADQTNQKKTSLPFKPVP
jgi:hypothetical protein